MKKHDANQAQAQAQNTSAAIQNPLPKESPLPIPKQVVVDSSKKILDEKNKVLEKPKAAWEELVSIGENNAFTSQHDSLLSLESEIDRSLLLNDFNKAVFLLDLLKEKAGVFDANAKAFFKEKTSLLSGRISAFKKSVSKEIPEKISSLISMLESVPEEPLLKLGYVSPFSKERLQKLELQLGVLDSPKLSEKFSSFKELVSKEKFSDAIKKFSEFEKDFSKKEAELNSINSELDSALSTMKEDAVSAANKAVSVINGSAFNAEAIDLIGKAKTALEKNQFLKSIAFSNAATGMAAMQKTDFPVPIFFVPILIGIALVFVVRYKKKQFLEKKVQFRKILRNKAE